MISKTKTQFILSAKEWNTIKEAREIMKSMANTISSLKAFSSNDSEDVEKNCKDIISKIDYLVENKSIILKVGE